ncbi:DUF4132 domain-containing protein [Paenibacillus sp. 2TAB23]|uniref:DUF4132 domain-containing protein n=1 Tax=Paenibacillus sp. 2TAB23 TaxID=3233004 RepID=UPI003F9AB505
MDRAEQKLYFQQMNDKAAVIPLSDAHQRLALLLVRLGERGYNDYEISAEIKEQLLILASGEEQPLFEPLAVIMEKLLDAPYGRVFRYISEHAIEYPYSTGYARRPFRTKEQRLHVDRLLTKLISLFYLQARHFSVTDYLAIPGYLSENEYQFPAMAIADMVAYAIDAGDDAVMEALKDVIYGDNNTALLSRAMISGIFLSHNRDAYRMIGELLVAARLQEGLRQSIVEAMDEGTIEAMTDMMKVITEHDLIRYSSVIRALDVWTGLALEASNARVARQNIDYAAQCLTDPAALREGLASHDVNMLFMSLWATAVLEEKQLYEQISLIMAREEPFRQIVAQYMLVQSQNEDIRFLIAQDWLGEPHKEVQYWVLQNYTFDYSFEWESDSQGAYRRLVFRRSVLLEDKTVRERQYEQFKAMLASVAAADSEERSKVFPWVSYSFTADMVVRKLLYLAAYDMDREWIADIIAIKDKLSSDMRGELLRFFISDPSDSAQRAFLLASLADKSMSNREIAIHKASELALSEDELAAVASLLKLKTGTLRQAAIGLLLKQAPNQLTAVLELLLQSRNELQRLAALELLTEMKEEPRLAELSSAMKDEVDLMEEPTEKERLLIAKLKQQTAYTLSAGLGLFDPLLVQEELAGKAQLPLSALADGKRYFTLTIEQISGFVRGLADLIHLHREHEYEATDYSGAKQTLLVGAQLTKMNWRYEPDDATPELERYPLASLWSDYLDSSGFGPGELLQFQFLRIEYKLYSYAAGELEHWESAHYKPAEGWRKELLDQLYPLDLMREVHLLGESLPYSSQVYRIINAYVEDSRGKEQFETSRHFLSLIISCFPFECAKEESRLLDLFTGFWNRMLRSNSRDDESFVEWIRTIYPLYERFGFEQQLLDTKDFARAFSLGVIDENELYKELLSRPHSATHIRQLTHPKRKLIETYPQLAAIKDTVVQRILELELSRGELATEVTHLAMGIMHIEGIRTFIAILEGLDKESFVRGYIYGYGKDITRKETFCHLLKACSPGANEDAALLREQLLQKNISEIRLLEAAMYAPQWVDLISDYLGWDGLRSAAWYFHAHINESFSAEKETVVAHYSPIEPQDFNDGAFDIEWFRQAYDELGEERFRLLYQCAKYISAGANHRRSQLFADAVLGKLNASELQASIIEKRNKDLLLSYSLLPWGGEKEKAGEVLERYSFIQRFLKESKAFGAQRRASEEKASSIALDNLARNGGYADVIRLTWDMEGRKLDELLPYFEPHELDDGISAQLTIDESGKTEIHVIKQGKALKSVPASYKKHAYIAALKETKTELTDQYRRARTELERSMASGSGFTVQELGMLFRNPVLAPLVRDLVFKANGKLGYYSEGKLIDALGAWHVLEETDQLSIAHPLDLYASGEWSLFQKDLFDRQAVQPFKQVFRELYLPNADELAGGSLSRRYAGHQVQPRKTVSLLKSRKWTISYEEGLQKVYYKENVIASIYALADWFSPSDIESPTLETVQFFHRHSLKGLDISEVPSLVFSEVMRDIDLVVSVAHVGGVDPEASLTTIDMRLAIVRESLRLLKIDNVRFEGKHVLIDGKLGEYSIHLGSGVVHKLAKGALAIIPVHSQHRGRVFLPFMDEDPKTAEILSKIVLLAQDEKLKDPQILAQLQA